VSPSVLPAAPEQLRPSRLPRLPEADLELADEFVRMAREGYPPGIPLATWDPRSLTVTVRDGATTSVWSGEVIFVDGRPGGHVGWELVDVVLDDVTGGSDATDAAREVAFEILDGYADEIGGAR
jgi:hypothetical protein